jgi:RNA polymerase sigma-70 factor (ECF subfamily)
MNDFHRRLEKEIPRLRRYASALTRNEIRADDLVQDTLTRAIEKEHLWEPGTDLRAWLFTIMHNQNVILVRRHKARFSLSISTYYPIAEAGGVDEGTFLPTCFLGAQPA